MSIYDRFKSAFASSEVELARSLPVCNKGKEIMFFYSTRPNNSNSFCFEALHHVYRRDVLTSEVNDITDTLLQSDIVKACSGAIIRPLLMGEEAYEKEDEYEFLYENFYRHYISKDFDHGFSETCRQLRECFDSLIPQSPLKLLYETIGSEFFEILQKKG